MFHKDYTTINDLSTTSAVNKMNFHEKIAGKTASE